MFSPYFRKAQRELFCKALSLALSFVFIFSSTISPANAAPTSGNVSPVESALVNELTPSPEIGSIVDAHVTVQTPLVIHIQDLHANYSVQGNIVKLLEFLDSKLGAGNYKVAVEGAEGPIAITQFAKVTDQGFKAKVFDRLMKEAEITGTEYFSIVSGQPDLLWGVEDHRYHEANISLFQSTYRGKQQLAQSLDSLQKDLLPIKDKYYSRSMRKLDKEAAKYEAGKISLASYTSDLVKQASKQGIDIATRYPEIAKWSGYAQAEKYADMDKLMTEQSDLLKEIQAGHAKNEIQRNVSATVAELDVLHRLLTEEVTTEEVRHLAPQLSAVAGRAQYLLDNAGLSYDKANLASLISASLDFYAVALLRDKYLAENTLKMFQNPQSKIQSVVLVTGGFHTPGITKILKEKGVSYITIAPTVAEHTDHDKQLYVATLMGYHVNPADIASGNKMLQRALVGGGAEAAVSKAVTMSAGGVQPLASEVAAAAREVAAAVPAENGAITIQVSQHLQNLTDNQATIVVPPPPPGSDPIKSVVDSIIAVHHKLAPYRDRLAQVLFPGESNEPVSAADLVPGRVLSFIPVGGFNAPDEEGGGFAPIVPSGSRTAATVEELLQNIKSALVMTPSGVRIVDENLLRTQMVRYLVDEARLSKVKNVRESAQRILREAGIALGAKEASVHDFYMARTAGKWSNATMPAYNVRVNAFETMKQIFRAAIDDNSQFILELAKSEKRYTDQSLAEFTAMGYAAAIATGYKGLIFFQGDHYQTDKGVYAKDPAKAMKDIENLILEAVMAGKRNIDVDPSTLVNEEALDKILAFEKGIVDRYIEKRSEVDAAFAENVAKLGGIQADVTKESAGMKTVRRKLVDDLEVGYQTGDEYQDYRYSLSPKEIEYIEKFGMTDAEKAEISALYHEMHATTYEVTMHYIRYIRNLEKELGIKTPISVGVEERHIDTPKHKDFPSTVLGSITLVRQVIDQTAKEGLVGPSKLALQTGTMHGMGGVVEWGIFERHQNARKAIGVEIFVQHGTSTLDKSDFKNMPKAGTGEAHLATEYQKISLGVIASNLPDLLHKMAAFSEALIYPDRPISDPEIETKIKEAKLFDVEKRKNEYEKKFRAKWEAAMAQEGKTRDQILVEIFNDSLPGKMKGSLKDLVKELSGPFKAEIVEIPTDVQNISNETLYTEFRRINQDQNFVGMRKTMDEIVPYDSQDATLPARSQALEQAVAASGSAANRWGRSALLVGLSLILAYFVPWLGAIYFVYNLVAMGSGIRRAGWNPLARAASSNDVEGAGIALFGEENGHRVLKRIPLVGNLLAGETSSTFYNETIGEILPNILAPVAFVAALAELIIQIIRHGGLLDGNGQVNQALVGGLETLANAKALAMNLAEAIEMVIQQLRNRGVSETEIEALRKRGVAAIFAAA